MAKQTDLLEFPRLLLLLLRCRHRSSSTLPAHRQVCTLRHSLLVLCRCSLLRRLALLRITFCAFLLLLLLLLGLRSAGLS